MSSPEEQIEIPATALVQCPMVRFELRPVEKCVDAGGGQPCPHFRGLEDRFPNAKHLKFSQRYTVKCVGEPVKRQILNLVRD